jgi:putative spermidine/putrescine transport system substrate-binding protein
MRHVHTLCAALVLAAALWPVAPAVPAGKYDGQTMSVYAGISRNVKEDIMAYIAPRLKEKYGLALSVDPIGSAIMIQKVLAAKEKPPVSVAGWDEPIGIDACNKGLCSVLEAAAVPNAAKVYPWALTRINGKPMVVATAVTGPGIIYNLDIFAQNHLKQPISWNDLWREDLKGRVTIPAPESTMGLGTLVMFARIGGGGEANIAPGFEKVKSLLPHIQRLYTWSTELAQLLQLNEVWMASTQADLGPGLRAQGFPAAWVAPKEGAPMVNGGMSVIANAPFQDAALEYVNLYVSPEFAALRARHGGVVPTNPGAWEKLSPSERSGMPLSPQEISRLVRLDWDVINRDRAKWVEQWHKIVQR